MKNLIIALLFLYTSIGYCQFDLIANQTNGKYSQATNNTTLMGVASGDIKIPVYFTVSDTSSNWTLLPNSTNGKYSIITNAVTFMGKSANTVQIPVTFDIGSVTVAFDTSLFVKKSGYSLIDGEKHFTDAATYFENVNVQGTNYGVDMITPVADFTVSVPSGALIFTADGDMNFSSASTINFNSTISLTQGIDETLKMSILINDHLYLIQLIDGE